MENKGGASELKDRLQKNKHLLRSFSRSLTTNLKLERHRQRIRQLIILKTNEEENE
jgi:hypothetical protein